MQLQRLDMQDVVPPVRVHLKMVHGWDGRGHGVPNGRKSWSMAEAGGWSI